MALYYLFETASGYSLFTSSTLEEIGAAVNRESIASRKRFKKIVSLAAFYPFTSAEQALANMLAVSEGECHEDLAEFLQLNMPSTKKSKYMLAVEDARLPNSINKVFPKLQCKRNETVLEVFRGIRTHFENFMKEMSESDLAKGKLGLAHSYSRSRVQFDVKRHDKHIIHAISLLDQLDKDINTFAMRLKEWFSWHFPELVRIVGDNILFAKIVKIIQSKAGVNPKTLKKIEKVVGSEELTNEIQEAAARSMGGDISEIDTIQISTFTEKIVNLAQFREKISQYLKDKMGQVAPNLSALVGEIVGARLVSQAGGLFALAKLPASTVQILGAEKALFRALKTRGNTPKYGLLYHSSFIGRASQADKGKISRFLANKCSIAARIDAFFPYITSAFGERMNAQVEERLITVQTGEKGPPNEDVMREVMESLELPKKRSRTDKSDKKSKSEKKADKSDKKSKSEKKADKSDKKSKKAEKKSEKSGKKSRKKQKVEEEEEEVLKKSSKHKKKSSKS